MTITLASLHVYPVKSCRGIDISQARLAATGLEHDREWMVVTAAGRFVTQREAPRLALVTPWLDDEGLQLEVPGCGDVFIPFGSRGEAITATVWQDRCGAFDMGARAAELLSDFLGSPHRLVRFNPATRRASDPRWTGEVTALNQFSDGFPLLGLSTASLEDLNGRLAEPVQMNRFRPNLVFSGLPPYGEDALAELHGGDFVLRMVKPCTRCRITTTDPATGEVRGTEPIDTLRRYRTSSDPPGVTFGQNIVPVAGVGGTLAIGQAFTPLWR